MHVVIFEGSYWKELAPISLSRPVFDLALGASTLLDKQVRHLAPTRLTLWVRPELKRYCETQIVPRLNVATAVNEPLNDEPALLMNGRRVLFAKYEIPHESSVMVDDDDPLQVRTARVTMPGLAPADVFSRTGKWLELCDLPHMPAQGRMANYLWDLLAWNEEAIVEDAIPRKRAGGHVVPSGPFHLINSDEIWLDEGAKIGPGCVIDASKGPVILGPGASVGANSVVIGPVSVGARSAIQPLSLIRSGTTIGPGCKVGGEVSSAIIQGNTNKAHHGYLGDSYVGEWVNLAAGTSTSNLKTTYGEVNVSLGPREFKTGRRFLGSLIGDHSKTAIDTRLMTGTYIGYSAMIAMSGLTPRFVPTFTFLTDRGQEPYRMDKATEVMKQVFARRDREWTEGDEELARFVAREAPKIEQPVIV